LLVVAVVAACGGTSELEPPPGSVEDGTPCDGESFPSTFAAIQTLIFERRGCSQNVCHGAAAAGGLDLSPEVAYRNLFEVPSAGSQWRRIEPGDNDRSFLWLKLAAKTRPESVAVPGAAMPSGLPALTEEELDAIHLWIWAGAPETGNVTGTGDLLDACLPALEPITIDVLEPPPRGEGVQFVLPPVPLPAGSEKEICFAVYYDLDDQVPPEMRDPTGTYFRIRAQEVRQDPQSHHLVLIHPGVDVADLHHPSFGAWTCNSGERHGASCEPTDLGACGSGFCQSEVQEHALGCTGFGPPTVSAGTIQQTMGGTQQTQAILELPDGVFAQYPVRGIAYWNSHSFNLTAVDHVLAGRINFTFAAAQRHPMQAITDLTYIFAPSAPPFTNQVVCAEYVLPQGARLLGLSSHTHKRGEHFWAELPDGSRIYESFLYNDPVKLQFDPPLAFDSADPAARAIHYCARYNNGVALDGSPDPETATRASRIPESAVATVGACQPAACVAGKIAAPCQGHEDDRACDSVPGAMDGWCDACRITGGESTENEMFLLLGQYYVHETFPQPPVDGPVFAGVAGLPPRAGFHSGIARERAESRPARRPRCRQG
jgi:hypothetical protein